MIYRLLLGALTTTPKSPGQPCTWTGSSFMGIPGVPNTGFPTWYKYLPGMGSSTNPISGSNPTGAPIVCAPQLGSINDIWLIVAAVIEILLRVAALAAIFMIIYAGIHFVTSQGDPESTKKARSTIINALVGLLLTVMAATFVNFIARSIS